LCFSVTKHTALRCKNTILVGS